MKVKVSDQVLVISGKDKGTKGEVLRVFPKQEKIVVKGVNVRTKHIRKHGGQAGDRIKLEKPIHVSNVKVICPVLNKPTRIGYVIENGKKKRMCKVSKEVLNDTIATSKKS